MDCSILPAERTPQGEILGSGGYTVREQHALGGTRVKAGSEIFPFQFTIRAPDGNVVFRPGMFVTATANIFFAGEYRVFQSGVRMTMLPVHPSGMIELRIGPLMTPRVSMDGLYAVQISIDTMVDGEWLYLAWICPTNFFIL
jgi:hypothetical protein